MNQMKRLIPAILFLCYLAFAPSVGAETDTDVSSEVAKLVETHITEKEIIRQTVINDINELSYDDQMALRKVLQDMDASERTEVETITLEELTKIYREDNNFAYVIETSSTGELLFLASMCMGAVVCLAFLMVPLM